MKMPEVLHIGVHSEDARYMHPGEIAGMEKAWYSVDENDTRSKCNNGFVAEYRFVRLLKVTTETKTITTVEEVQ